MRLLKQQVPSMPALSPDGKYVSFNGVERGGGSRLWVRGLDDLKARPLPGTEGTAVLVPGERRRGIRLPRGWPGVSQSGDLRRSATNNRTADPTPTG